MCGVAAGSTKASITAHMAVQGNTADVAGKEGAQETLVSQIRGHLAATVQENVII